MGQRIIGYERHVRTAKNNRHTAPPKMIGQFIGTHCRAGNDGESDQVRVEVQWHVCDSLIVQFQVNVQFRRDQGGKRSQGQWLISQRFLPNPATMPIQRTFRRNEGDFKFLRPHK